MPISRASHRRLAETTRERPPDGAGGEDGRGAWASHHALNQAWHNLLSSARRGKAEGNGGRVPPPCRPWLASVLDGGLRHHLPSMSCADGGRLLGLIGWPFARWSAGSTEELAGRRGLGGDPLVVLAACSPGCGSSREKDVCGASGGYGYGRAWGVCQSIWQWDWQFPSTAPVAGVPVVAAVAGGAAV